MFNFTANVADLSYVLSSLGNTTGKNANNSNDDCLYMETTGNSVIFKTTNSIEYTAIEMIVGLCSNAGEVAPLVDFSKFSKMIATLKTVASDVEVAEENANTVKIKWLQGQNKTPNSIELTSKIGHGMFLPEPSLQGGDHIEVPATKFMESMNTVSTIIETSNTSQIYECIRVATDNNDVSISALDYNSKRMACDIIKATSQNPIAEVLVEGKKVAKNAKIFSNADELSLDMDNNFVSITVSTWVNQAPHNIVDVRYYCRRFAGSYPNTIAQSLSIGTTSSMTVPLEELNHILARIAVIEDKATQPAHVTLKASKDNLNVSYKSTYGKIDEDIVLTNNVTGNIDVTFKLSSFMEILNTIPASSKVNIGKINTNPNASYYLINEDQMSYPLFGISEIMVGKP